MGIQGLLPLLKSIHKQTELKNFKGETLGIDAYGWLHRGAVGCAIELAQGRPTRKYVDFAMHRVRMVKHFGVIPYLVFDGDHLPSKARTEAYRAKRREDSRKTGLELLKAGKPSQAQIELQKAIDVTPEMARQLIDELKKENVSFVVAPYEADAQLIYLERHGFTDGSISEDSDLLVFGAKRLLTKMDQYGQCVEINRRDFCGVREISLTGWTDEQFRQMAIFSGCDYLDRIGNMGLKTAYRMMRKHKTPEQVIRMLQLDSKFRVSENYLAQYKQAELTFLHQRVFCPKRQEVVLLTEPQLSSALEIEDMPYIGARVDPKLARAIAMGDVNPMTKQPITVATLPDRRSSTHLQSSGTAKSGLGRRAPGKPIKDFFKNHRRVPMGEMDRNCFAVDPERVADLTQNGLTPRVFPLPRPYLQDTNASQRPRPQPHSRPTIQRRRTEQVSRTLRSLDPTFDSAAPRREAVDDGRRISDADPRPPKKARLCEDISTKDGAELVPKMSKFSHPGQTAESSSRSDKFIEEASASTYDVGGEWICSRSLGSRQPLQILPDATASELANDDLVNEDETDAGNQRAFGRPHETDRIADSSGTKTEGGAFGRTLCGALNRFAYTPHERKTVRARPAFGLPTPPSSIQMSQPRQMALTTIETSLQTSLQTPLQTPLQRIRAAALHKERRSASPVTKPKSPSKNRSSPIEALDSFPINPASIPLPKADLAEVEALNKPGGSEDQILSDSDEENCPPAAAINTKHDANRRFDVSMYVFPWK